MSPAVAVCALIMRSQAEVKLNFCPRSVGAWLGAALCCCFHAPELVVPVSLLLWKSFLTPALHSHILPPPSASCSFTLEVF